MICHKFCYTLVSHTCQEYLNLKKAMKYYFMANDEQDKMRWISGLDIVRHNLKEHTKADVSKFGGGDIDSLLGREADI